MGEKVERSDQRRAVSREKGDGVRERSNSGREMKDEKKREIEPAKDGFEREKGDSIREREDNVDIKPRVWHVYHRWKRRIVLVSK